MRYRGITVSLLAAVLIMPLVLSGCGASTPEAAVKDMFSAVAANNWNAFLSSIYPENVRMMSDEDVQIWRDEIKTIGESVEVVPEHIKVEVDRLSEDEAVVKIMGGSVYLTNPMGGKMAIDIDKMLMTFEDPETAEKIEQEYMGEISDLMNDLNIQVAYIMSLEEIEGDGQYQEPRALFYGEYLVKKYKGGWYVDLPLNQALTTPMIQM